jgi:predicted anti-sigma-YlaC factor YlaD
VSRLNRLVGVLTLRCEAASELMSRELDDPLPRLDRVALLCHLVACRSCRRFRAQVRLIRKAVRRRVQLLAEADSIEGGLSAEARHRIALACQELGRRDAGAETTTE